MLKREFQLLSWQEMDGTRANKLLTLLKRLVHAKELSRNFMRISNKVTQSLKASRL